MIELKLGFYKEKEDYGLKEVKQNHGGGSIDREIAEGNESVMEEKERKEEIYIYIDIGKEGDRK